MAACHTSRALSSVSTGSLHDKQKRFHTSKLLLSAKVPYAEAHLSKGIKTTTTNKTHESLLPNYGLLMPEPWPSEDDDLVGCTSK